MKQMELAMERIKVLYVDDEEGNLMAFRASFRREFDVHVCLTAAEALEWLEQHTAHVVISDQRMPGMSGSEFLAIVRNRWPKAVRLLLTGFSDIQAVVEAINLGGIHAYITKPWDPTDLKLRIEQAHEVHVLRAQRDRLFERYRQVFDASGDPIVILDAKGRSVELNAAAKALLRTNVPIAAGTDLSRYVLDMPDLLRRVRSRRQGTTFHNVDVTLRIPGGITVDCLITATQVGKDAEGHSLYQAMIKDITDRKQQEQYLKKLNSDLDKRVAVRTKQLMEALDDLGAFSYSVAHDLRSPLKNIKVMSDHLASLAAMREDEEERDLSKRIHKGVSRLINLVDDLLRFARTDSKTVAFSECQLTALMEECVREAKPHPANIKFVFNLPEDAQVYADPSMVKVALNNLIANAIKFSRTRPQGVVELGMVREEEHDLLYVKDNGVGFDTEKKDQLFGVFKRLHPAAQFEGTGIGLALVDRIMKKHNGVCWAEGATDQGATVFLRFPRAARELLQAS